MKLLESTVNSKGNQPWIFIERTDAEAEVPVLWPPDVKSQHWLFQWKDPDSGKDWGQEEKGTTEEEMVGWHHRLHAHEFEQALGVSHEQGSLVCCCPWGCKELEITEWLNWTEEIFNKKWNLNFHSIKFSRFHSTDTGLLGSALLQCHPAMPGKSSPQSSALKLSQTG